MVTLPPFTTSSDWLKDSNDFSSAAKPVRLRENTKSAASSKDRSRFALFLIFTVSSL